MFSHSLHFLYSNSGFVPYLCVLMHYISHCSYTPGLCNTNYRLQAFFFFFHWWPFNLYKIMAKMRQSCSKNAVKLAANRGKNMRLSAWKRNAHVWMQPNKLTCCTLSRSPLLCVFFSFFLLSPIMLTVTSPVFILGFYFFKSLAVSWTFVCPPISAWREFTPSGFFPILW